jgi:hypothetical protein
MADYRAVLRARTACEQQQQRQQRQQQQQAGAGGVDGVTWPWPGGKGACDVKVRRLRTLCKAAVLLPCVTRPHCRCSHITLE